MVTTRCHWFHLCIALPAEQPELDAMCFFDVYGLSFIFLITTGQYRDKGFDSSPLKSCSGHFFSNAGTTKKLRVRIELTMQAIQEVFEVFVFQRKDISQIHLVFRCILNPEGPCMVYVPTFVWFLW